MEKERDGFSQIKKDDFIRLIIQALYSLQHTKSAEMLSQEANIRLQSSAVENFCDGVLQAKWDSVVDLLSELDIASEKSLASAKFLIYRQKFLELLEEGNKLEALECLRKELTPLDQSFSKIQKLSSLIMCMDLAELRRTAEWDGAEGESRKKLLEKLRKFIPSSALLPERRLEKLILQALEAQIKQCLYHNTSEQQLSLFEDHICAPDHIPTSTKYILTNHKDEVWYVQFSHSGKYLVSASRDKTAIIWSVGEEGIKELYSLKGHAKDISNVAFSPNDKYLATSANDHMIKIWSMETGACLRTCSKHTQAVTACAWMPDSKHFVSGSLDTKIHMWDVNGKLVHTWDWATSQIHTMLVTPDGKYLIVTCQEYQIFLFNLDDESLESLTEASSITSLTISDDGKFLLVNISSKAGFNEEIHVWDLETKTQVKKYRGQKQTKYIIQSCFGGADQSFILSGSEDSNVYIWNREHGTLLESLPGHTGVVNSVSWNPTNPYQFASASDDRTIRIWESKYSCILKQKQAKKRNKNKRGMGATTNGYHNGKGKEVDDNEQIENGVKFSLPDESSDMNLVDDDNT